jgi:hypothetical protein
MKKKGEKRKIRGFITPSAWDSEDNVIELSISTDDADYIVKSDKKASELYDLINEDVEIMGIVTENGNGIKSITVISLKKLNENDYEEGGNF